MKSITVYFEDMEFEKLKEVKKDNSWHDFIFQLAENDSNNKKMKVDNKNVKSKRI